MNPELGNAEAAIRDQELWTTTVNVGHMEMRSAVVAPVFMERDGA